jgi:hypothetical protein
MSLNGIDLSAPLREINNFLQARPESSDSSSDCVLAKSKPACRK